MKKRTLIVVVLAIAAATGSARATGDSRTWGADLMKRPPRACPTCRGPRGTAGTVTPSRGPLRVETRRARRQAEVARRAIQGNSHVI